jgi:Streptomycin adenylyltransferase
MTEHFTPRRRVEVLENFIAFFGADHSIAGLVLVGSSAESEPDIFSGLDFLVIVANGAIFPSVYRKWKQRLHDILPLAYEFEAENRIDYAAYSLMLEDYLELNLYFMPQKSLLIESNPWQVLFDHSSSQDIEQALENAYRKERSIAPSRSYKQMLDSIWQPIIKAVSALNRGETWRVLYMLDRLRQQTIEIAAMNYEVDTRNYAEVDQLPEMLLIKLRHSIPTGLDKVALRRALLVTMDIFFQQAGLLEARLGYKLAEGVKQKILPYIEAYS